MFICNVIFIWSYSRAIDDFVYRTKTTVCIAAGNPVSSGQSIHDTYMNQFGLAPNVITVGAVTRYGTDPTVPGAYQVANYSLYREATNTVNKPDICAPGNISIYSFNNLTGTSLSTPLITGTVIQMMARNSGLRDKPETLKAALMASATFNGGSDMSYVTNTIGSDREGAGVVDAAFCNYVARNGRRTHFDANANTSSYTVNAYCDYTNRPFRIAISWYVNSDKNAGTTKKTDFDLSIFKDGVYIASSSAWANSTLHPCSNYELISIPASILQQYGAGYYQIKVTRYGDFNGPTPNRIGVAWEQRR